MQAIIIGFVGGLVTIFVLSLLKKIDKPAIYALVLSGIGFLYVGYTWSDPVSLVSTSLQAILFVFIAYYGIKNTRLLALGYFLHGGWDLLYSVIPLPNLLPPHYDLFCLTIDFVMGAYLLLLAKRQSKHTNLTFDL